MNRRALIFGGILLAIVIVLGLITYTIRTERIKREKDAAADVLFSVQAKEAYTDIEGRDIDLQGFDNKVVVITSWASWCPQCADELMLLNGAARERNDERLQVLAINRNESKEMAQRFISTLPELERVNFVLDNQDFFFDSVVGYAMPETLFYNQAGELVVHKRGNLTPDEVRAAFDVALGSGDE